MLHTQFIWGFSLLLLTYGSQVWGQIKSEHSNRLKRLQNKGGGDGGDVFTCLAYTKEFHEMNQTLFMEKIYFSLNFRKCKG